MQEGKENYAFNFMEVHIKKNHTEIVYSLKVAKDQHFSMVRPNLDQSPIPMISFLATVYF